MKYRECPSCKSLDIIQDSTRGETTCNGCGKVLEENIVVSEVY